MFCSRVLQRPRSIFPPPPSRPPFSPPQKSFYRFLRDQIITRWCKKEKRKKRNLFQLLFLLPLPSSSSSPLFVYTLYRWSERCATSRDEEKMWYTVRGEKERKIAREKPVRALREKRKKRERGEKKGKKRKKKNTRWKRNVDESEKNEGHTNFLRCWPAI